MPVPSTSRAPRARLALAWAAAAALTACADAAPARPDGALPPAPHDAALASFDGGPRGDAEAAPTDAASALDAASASDAAVDADAASTPDAAIGPDAAPAAYVPDPVTLGQPLPPAVPALKITVGGAPIELDVSTPGTLELFEDPAATTPTLTMPIGIEGRGNFTWSLPKQGYGVELQDGAGGEQDTAILGLPPGSDFALYACYLDKTCLRNALVLAIGQELGRWSPRARFVELYLDGEYRGLYMLWERVRHAVDRVDAPVIVRHEGGPEGDGSDFTTRSNTYYRYHYPKVTRLSPAEATSIVDSWQAMEDALAADTASAAAVIDVASWVDHAIVEEVTHNWDGYVHSIYMTRSAAGLIGMGPLWDYDLAFGNGNVTGYNCLTDVWTYQIQRPYPDDVPAYWRALWADAAFDRAFKCRYQALRAGPLADATFAARIDGWSVFLADARARDQARWPTIGVPTFPNCTTEPTYDAEIVFLRSWIARRLAWLDAQAAAIPGACP